MLDRCEVAIIGARPFGLSIAAYLRDRGIQFRIFGKAMSTWSTQMPKGMHLKSDGFATSLYDPGRKHSYKKYCADHGIPYDDLAIAPPIEAFIAHGLDFQKALVPNLEDRTVTAIESTSEGHVLKFTEGPDCIVKSLIVAAGISHFAYIPDILSNLPRTLLTHSSEHHDLSVFKGRKVAVIGAGSSAADVSGLLHQAGAETHLICRGIIWFHNKMKLPRPLYDRLRWPASVIGPSWRSFFLAKFPLVFHRLPLETRLKIVRTYLGPAPAYFSKDMVLGRVTTHLGLEPKGAIPSGDGIELTLANSGGEERKFQADHVICATGYKSTLAGLPFMTPALLQRIKSVAGTPVLNTNFESSVPGLYFVGALAANSFGPVVRFACGAEFAAPRLANHLARIHPKQGPYVAPAAGTAAPYAPPGQQTVPASSGEGR
jgi:Pyridine nucleotide-disulphide oxidoreductase